MRLSGDRDGAADLLQSCAMKALASDTVPDAAGIRSWLFAILRNGFFDDRRRASVRADHSDVETGLDTPWRHDDRLIAEITVKQGLDRLDATHRDIIELVDLAGFRYAEAAEILGVPVGTVMSRLSRARLALLDEIGGRNVTTLPTGRARVERR
jgi:RNA polymerase sigma-70 factor, ECF subfamily